MGKRIHAWRLGICLAAALGVAVTTAPLPTAARAQREPPVPKELLERVGEWAERYLDATLNYAAEESLRQTEFNRKRRGTMREIVCEYIQVRFGDSGPRSEFRDLLSIDGGEARPAAEREVRWARMLAARSPAELAALVEDPSKRNITADSASGLALLVGRLATRHQGKFKYYFAQDTSDVVSSTTLIGYRQIAGEGLARVEKSAVMAAGLAWIEPDDGHIERIEEEITLKDTRFYTAVEFTKSPELDARVPATITLRIFEKNLMSLENVYTYANFRRFEPARATAGNAGKN